MNIRLTQIDGSLPNLALMKLSHYHKAQGDQVYFEPSVRRSMFEPDYQKVYASAIFSTSQKKITLFKTEFPDAIIGGTGSQSCFTVESLLKVNSYEYYDYSIYPDFRHSIGFSQRGCRLRCSLCVVPKKEGKISDLSPIKSIYRGEPYPKNIILLDNDFFGQKDWLAKSEEIIEAGYKICFSQGINVRLIHKQGAEALSKMNYYDDSFKKRRIYTAWDNRRDEKIFRTGINLLLEAGIRPGHIMVYMLTGYWKEETFADVYYRFEKMIDMGLMPYPMVYGENKQLKNFQRWVVRRYYQFVPWEEYGRITAKEGHRSDLFNQPSYNP